jgi:hypothetical protein
MKKPRSERAAKVVDAMTGVSLFSQGFAEMGQADGSRALVVVALSGGALILAGMFLRRWLGERFRYFHAVVSFFEGLVCALVGLAAMQRGTSYIHFAWFLAAAAFLIATVVHVRGAQRPPMAVPQEGIEMRDDESRLFVRPADAEHASELVAEFRKRSGQPDT